MAKKYDWIKEGVKCLWLDPDPNVGRKSLKYVCEVLDNGTSEDFPEVEDDTIVLISSGIGEIQVCPCELYGPKYVVKHYEELWEKRSVLKEDYLFHIVGVRRDAYGNAYYKKYDCSLEALREDMWEAFEDDLGIKCKSEKAFCGWCMKHPDLVKQSIENFWWYEHENDDECGDG